MTLLSLGATAIGAVIALACSVLADARRDRRDRNRRHAQFRQEAYVEFALALNLAHVGLRQAAASMIERHATADEAIAESGLYSVREQLLMSSTVPVAKAGEAAFLRLIDIRTAVRAGAVTGSQPYHDVYHPFADALWQFLMAVRVELRQPALPPDSVDRAAWSERLECDFCNHLPVT